MFYKQTGSNINVMKFSAATSPSQGSPATLSAQIKYLRDGVPERVRLESFINRVYKKYFNAEVGQFYPNLISIETSKDNSLTGKQTITAVAGIRCAKDEALFSEHYLHNSLESELERIYQKPIPRQLVVEVGNLAPESAGQMRWLIITITGFLYSAGYEYIVFTLVPGIYNAFKRMNLPLELLAEAKYDCLPDNLKQKWGPEYYKKKPMVRVGDIILGFNIVKEMVYNTHKNLIPLFKQACHLGHEAALFDQLKNSPCKEMSA